MQILSLDPILFNYIFSLGQVRMQYQQYFDFDHYSLLKDTVI